MHELTLAKGIIQIVESEAKKHGFTKVLEISLCIGEYSGIVPDCLREFFPLAAEGTPAQGAALRIESVPAAFQCLDCGYEGPVDRKEACCPRCKSSAIKLTAGREFYVANLKVE